MQGKLYDTEEEAIEAWNKRVTSEAAQDDYKEINLKNAVNRQEAINKIKEINSTMSVCINLDECHGMKRMQELAISEIENMLPYRESGGE